MIPRFMLGNIWNKDSNYTDQNIRELIKKFNKNSIPINYILLGNKWHSKQNNEYGLSWNNDLFIDYNKFIDYLKLKGIHLGVTINPIVINNKEDKFNNFITLNNLEDRENIPLNVFNKDIMNSYLNLFCLNYIFYYKNLCNTYLILLFLNILCFLIFYLMIY